jgi:putative ABC transport system substrate-binding protein
LIFISLSILSCTNTPKENKYVIGIINPNPKLIAVTNGFKSEMTGHGYIEGENITYVNVDNSGEIDSALLDFKEQTVDLVLTFTTPATKKAKNALKGTGIPVVFTSFDPVRGGIVKSLSNQEENITGIKVGGNTQKALEWLLAISPETRRILVPVKFDTKAASLSLAALKEGAAKLKVDLIVSNVETIEDLQATLSSMPEDVGAIFILNSIFIVTNLDLIVETAIKHKIPTGGGSGQYKNGLTITYGRSHKRSGENAGRLAHKILHGTPASSLPIETEDFFLGINLRTARASGLKIPYFVLDQADFIIR